MDRSNGTATHTRLCGICHDPLLSDAKLYATMHEPGGKAAFKAMFTRPGHTPPDFWCVSGQGVA